MPSTPLREKRGTGVAPVTQAISGSGVNVTDPRATIFWKSGTGVRGVGGGSFVWSLSVSMRHIGRRKVRRSDIDICMPALQSRTQDWQGFANRIIHGAAMGGR